MTGKLIDKLGGQSRIEDALKRNLKWIIKSFSINNNLGSSSHSNIIGKFSPPYLETTGYLLPTLLSAAKYFDDNQYEELAFRQISFFQAYKNQDGSFYQKVNNSKPLVFDTSQILLGLCSIYNNKKSKELEKLIKDANQWLTNNLDDEGHFINYNYTLKTCPGYYARVFWAMLSANEIATVDNKSKVIAGIEKIVSSSLSNYSFNNWGFENEKYVLTHNIAYTLRGLYECALLLNDSHMYQLVNNTITTIDNIINSNGKLCGAYDDNWKADCSYICSTGNAQIAYLLSKVNIEKYQDAIVLLIKPILKAQKKFGINQGAVPSSIPIWGKYQRWRYTNWTQKFYCDALLNILSSQE